MELERKDLQNREKEKESVISTNYYYYDSLGGKD